MANGSEEATKSFMKLMESKEKEIKILITLYPFSMSLDKQMKQFTSLHLCLTLTQ